MYPAEQLVQLAAAAALNCPGGHTAVMLLVEPGGQKYPATQLLQAVAPAKLNFPPGHSADTGFGLVDSDGHA